VNYTSIIEMAQGGYATGMPTDLSTLPTICEHCVLGKQTKKPVSKIWEGGRSRGLLDVVYSDLMGPEDVRTVGGAHYILNFVDDCSDMLWIYLLKEKSEAPGIFKGWRAQVENETGRKVKCYRTDNGGEFTSNKFETYLLNAGVKHQVTAPYTSAQNGRSERSHRTIMDRTRAIRSSAALPPKLWGECTLTSAYVKNRTPTHGLKHKTPFEAWYGKKPDLSHMRELGCRAWVLKQMDNPKIYSRSIECVLISYSPNSKAYRCYHRATGRVLTSRDVSFIE